MTTNSKSKVIQLSITEKVMYGLGTVLLFGGGFIWYRKSQKDKAQEASTDYGEVNTAVEPYTPASSVSNPPKTPSSATPTYVSNTTPTPVLTPVTIRDAEKWGYKIGQEVMANLKNGTQTYVPKKLANGNYDSDGTKQVKINFGDPIGTIIWVGKKPNGTFRYVVKRVGRLNFISFHWIADTRQIAPFGKILGTFNASQLDINKLLKFNSTGDEVKELQKRLKISVDKGVGIFGKNTRNALFQQKKLVEIRLKDWK